EFTAELHRMALPAPTDVIEELKIVDLEGLGTVERIAERCETHDLYIWWTLGGTVVGNDCAEPEASERGLVQRLVAGAFIPRKCKPELMNQARRKDIRIAQYEILLSAFINDAETRHVIGWPLVELVSAICIAEKICR